MESELRQFLATRRARLTPEQVGLPDFGGRRRVQGLRREEVALLAGMSVEYYVKFERGVATGVSESIIDGICRALKFDEVERAHLTDLVRAADAGGRPSRRRTLPRRTGVSPMTQQLLDAMTGVPALVQNGRLDLLGVNDMGRALFGDLFGRPGTPNFARYLFLDPRSEAFYRDWEESAEQLVALLRIETGRSPRDPALRDLIGELSMASEVFRTLWAIHDVREHRTGLKRIHHETLGDLELSYQALEVSGEPGLQLVAFTAPAESRTTTALQLLGNLVATATAERRS